MRPSEDELRVFGARRRSYCHPYCATNVISGNGQKKDRLERFVHTKTVYYVSNFMYILHMILLLFRLLIIIIITTSFAPISSKIKTSGATKPKAFSKLVIVKQCVSRQWMDEDAWKPRRRGSIK